MSTAIAKAAAATLAGVALLAAGAAQAQTSYGSTYQGPGSPGYNYDPCRRDANQRGTAGALIGGGMGAVIGSNAAARNARTEGALLGGLLGAIAGGVIGNKTAACTQPGYVSSVPPPPPRADAPYYDRDAYADSAAADAREDAWRDREYRDREPPERRVTERAPDAEDCKLAESPIYMPDGRTQTRFVRVCRDASGKYAVVD
ncbi:glycine zipper 2TM domain-containing protein [Phenylobacterium sp.]|jgi:hypothetical protein|uniref:glycine zipper 2TM domain-containing protein n=1 Tax=Phenylobacterium sp. TaxID=1871053 RepID=UPI002EDAB767